MNKKLFYNGDIVTMSNQTNIEAILVEDNIIKKIGSKENIFNFKDSDTEIIDLQGKTLMPAFIDPHSHLSAFAGTLGLVPLGNITNNDELIEKIKDFKSAKRIKDGEWIIGFGYDNNSFPNKKHPSKYILDKASSSNPILITHASGHMGVVNSLGLKEFGITTESKNPEGGVIGRVDGSNEPNGYLEENAFMQFSSKMPHPSIDIILKQLEEAQDTYLSFGITTAQEGLMKDNEFAILKCASETNKLKIDLIGYVDLKNSKHIVKDNSKYLKQYNNRLKIGGYKIFLDGSPQGKTAWLSKPYENSGDYCGYPIYQNNEVETFIKIAFDENMQLLTHCNGDAAADQLISCFEKVLGSNNSARSIRPVMIHAQTVREDELRKMSVLDMIASFFVAHTYYWGDTHIANLGMNRASKISPVKSAIEDGVVYTFHQDTPVILPNMLETVWCAVNRITKSGVKINSNEAVSPLDALKAVTINAAYQYFEENIKGSIEEGKLADLVILDKNPLKVDPMDIKNIKVLETIKEGKTLFKLK